MTSLEEAIRSAHGEEIAGVYKTFSSDLAAAAGDEAKIEEAEQRLRRGLSHAADVLARVRSAAKFG